MWPTPPEFKDTEGIWITSMLVDILFQDATIVLSSVSVECIVPLAFLLKSDEVIDRYFTPQAMGCLVSHGNKKINLVVTEAGAVVGLVDALGWWIGKFSNPQQVYPMLVIFDGKASDEVFLRPTTVDSIS